MKKIMVVLLLIAGGFLNACENKGDNNTGTSTFMDISWTRDAGNDIETIRFSFEGDFTYYCACGNPVNDSDLCEGYTYDEKTKTITLDCLEITDEMVTTIKVVKYTDTVLELDFDGEIRRFEKE